jgi:hypothetical protein
MADGLSNMSAVIPQFQDPTGRAQSTLAAANAGENWMTQASQRQQMQAQTEQTEQKTAQLQAMMPALVAKSQADIAVANSTIASAAIQQQFRQQAAEQIPAATQEYTDALKIADFNQRADALSTLQGKYSWLGESPDSKALSKAIDNARVNAHQEAVTDMQLKNQQAIWGQRTDATRYTADQRLTGTLAGVDARIQGIEQVAGNTALKGNVELQRTLLQEYGQAAAKYGIAATTTLDPNAANALNAKAQEYQKKFEQLSSQVGAAQAAPAPVAPKPQPKSTVTKVTAKPVKVANWDDARALESGTQYTGPDGQDYIRGSQ